MPGYGGYSYYTTCMLDTNSVGKITYNRRRSARIQPVRRATSTRSPSTASRSTSRTPRSYYKVSTVNYLAAGSCNFNDGGVSLWPLNQIVNDTQYYVRDAVIDYVRAMGTVSPAVEGRLVFKTPPTPNPPPAPNPSATPTPTPRPDSHPAFELHDHLGDPLARDDHLR